MTSTGTPGFGKTNDLETPGFGVPASVSGAVGPTGPTGPTGPAGGGEGASGGQTSQILTQDNYTGATHFVTSRDSVNAWDFYPPAWNLKGVNSDIPELTGGQLRPRNLLNLLDTNLNHIFPTLASAQAIYPWVDDLLPMIDQCAIQAAIDYAYRYSLPASSDTGPFLRTIFVPSGDYFGNLPIFVDNPNQVRCQNRVDSYPQGPAPTATGIATLGAITGGSGYTNGTYGNVALTGGSGSGASGNITVSGGEVTSVYLLNFGTGYAPADSLSAAAANIGGTGSGFSVPVSTISGWATGHPIPGVSGGTIPSGPFSGTVVSPNAQTNYRWNAATSYSVGDICIYNGVPFYCIQAHGSPGHAPNMPFPANILSGGPAVYNAYWEFYYQRIPLQNPGNPPRDPLGRIVANWSPTLRGEAGLAAVPSYGTNLYQRFTGGHGVIVGPNSDTSLDAFTVSMLQMVDTSVVPALGVGIAYNGGQDPNTVAIASFPCGGASQLKWSNLDAQYSYIGYMPAALGVLGDSSTLDKCGGLGSYVGIWNQGSQGYVSHMNDCAPGGTVGLISSTPSNVVGGNYSINGERGQKYAFTISSSVVTNFAYLGHSSNLSWGPGLSVNYTATDLCIAATLNLAGADNGAVANLNTSAYPDGRVGIFTAFIIKTASYGLVPFVPQTSFTIADGTYTYNTGTHQITLTTDEANGNAPLSAGETVYLPIGTYTGTGDYVNLLSRAWTVVSITGTSLVLQSVTAGSSAASITCVSHNGRAFFAPYNATTKVLRLKALPMWAKWNLGSSAGTSNTDLASDITAATTLYASELSFPFMGQINGVGVFVENGQGCNTCFCTNTTIAESYFEQPTFDWNVSMPEWSPDATADQNLNALYFVSQEFPWTVGPVQFNSGGYSSTPPFLRFSLMTDVQSFEQVTYKNMRVQGTLAGPSLHTRFDIANSSPFLGPGGSQPLNLRNGTFRGSTSLDTNPYFPAMFGSSAAAWGSDGGQYPVNGLGPNPFIVPLLRPEELMILGDPQGLPAPSASANGPQVAYPVIYGSQPHQTAEIGGFYETGVSADAINSNVLFESSHSFYSYMQDLTTTMIGDWVNSPTNTILWSAKGQSNAVYVSPRMMLAMFPGLVFGLDLVGTGSPGRTQWLLVTEVHPSITGAGLGYVRVWNLTGDGNLTAPNWVGGSKSQTYTGTVANSNAYFRAMPYRVRVISGNPVIYTPGSAVTQIVLSGQEVVADTNTSVFNLKFPANPQINDRIVVRPGVGDWATHNLTIIPNSTTGSMTSTSTTSNKINGSTSNMVLNSNPSSGAYTFIYIDANTSQGWKRYG